MFLRNKLWGRGLLSKLSVDVLPILLLPVITILASISFLWTIGVFICTAVGLYFIRRKFSRIRPRSTFFLFWILTSVMWLVLVFNLCVIPMVEIYPEENFFLVVMIIASLGCLYHSKMKAQKTLLPVNKAAYINGDMDYEDIDNMISIQNIDQPFFCHHCQANVQNKNHCLWLDCCIGHENEKMFVLGNIFGFFALLYGSNLSLTSICHPYVLYYPYLRLLFPDDCSDVYFTYTTAISFVCSLYSVFISLRVGLYLLKTILKKLGLNGWRICSRVTKA